MTDMVDMVLERKPSCEVEKWPICYLKMSVLLSLVSYQSDSASSSYHVRLT